LALKRYKRDWLFAMCFIFSVMALLVPLLTVMGLRDGIIGTLSERLISDPSNLEIVPEGVRDYDLAFFQNLENDPDVRFVIPNTRNFAFTLALGKPGYNTKRVAARSTKKGDPILDYVEPAVGNEEVGLFDIYPSKTVAEFFDAKPGDTLTVTVSRTLNGYLETQNLDLAVKGIIPLWALGDQDNSMMLANLQLLEKIERYFEDRPVPELGWPGNRMETYPARYQTFRLYASELDAVERLRVRFERGGLIVKTSAKEIANVKSLDSAFTVVFFTLLCVVGGGAFASAVSGSIDQVAKNRKSLACLNLLGMGKFHLQIFTSVQVTISGLIAAVGACGFYLVVAKILNEVFYGKMRDVAEVCRLSPEKLLISVGIVVIFMTLASFYANKSLSDIEPSEGMRDV
jgi:putative ABC transport system permease protein